MRFLGFISWASWKICIWSISGCLRAFNGSMAFSLLFRAYNPVRGRILSLKYFEMGFTLCAQNPSISKLWGFCTAGFLGKKFDQRSAVLGNPHELQEPEIEGYGTPPIATLRSFSNLNLKTKMPVLRGLRPSLQMSRARSVGKRTSMKASEEQEDALNFGTQYIRPSHCPSTPKTSKLTTVKAAKFSELEPKVATPTGSITIT